MEKDVKISVIVVCYNEEATIAATLDSILTQEEAPEFEILVSDDCSTDRTVEIVREYARRFPEIVRVHVNNHNMGVQANYFGAIGRAKGEYIADCAGDDYWVDKRKLAKQASILDRHPEVMLVHTGFEFLYPDGKTEVFHGQTGLRENKTHPESTVSEILCGTDKPFIHLCTSLYRKNPINSGLHRDRDIFMNPAYKCEDLQIMTYLAAAGKIAYMPEVTLRYRVGLPTLTSTESNKKTFDFYFGTLQLRYLLMEKFGVGPAEKKATLRRITLFLMSQAIMACSEERVEQLSRWMKEKRVRGNLKCRIYRILGKKRIMRLISHLKSGIKMGKNS